jgi:hypothetical protein
MLTRLPKWLVPLSVGALLLFGLFFSGVLGAIALLIVLAFVAWLTYLSWPAIGAGGRLLRLLLIALVLGAVVLALLS